MTATTATRLQNIHKRLAVGRADSLSMHKVWADVFEIPADDPHSQDWVPEAVMAFRAELDHARKQLDRLGVPPELTSSVFVRLKDAANPAVLGQTWANYKNDVSGQDMRLVLAWSVWVLRELGEPEVEQQQFEAIHQHLSQLEEMLQDPEVPPAIRDFVQRQVEDTRAALRKYPIQGIRALRKAVDATTGAFTTPDDEIIEELKQASPASRGVVRKSMEVLKETAEAVGHVEKLKTALEALTSSLPQLKAIGQAALTLLQS